MLVWGPVVWDSWDPRKWTGLLLQGSLPNHRPKPTIAVTTSWAVWHLAGLEFGRPFRQEVCAGALLMMCDDGHHKFRQSLLPNPGLIWRNRSQPSIYPICEVKWYPPICPEVLGCSILDLKIARWWDWNLEAVDLYQNKPNKGTEENPAMPRNPASLRDYSPLISLKAWGGHSLIPWGAWKRDVALERATRYVVFCSSLKWYCWWTKSCTTWDG